MLSVTEQDFHILIKVTTTNMMYLLEMPVYGGRIAGDGPGSVAVATPSPILQWKKSRSAAVMPQSIKTFMEF